MALFQVYIFFTSNVYLKRLLRHRRAGMRWCHFGLLRFHANDLRKVADCMRKAEVRVYLMGRKFGEHNVQQKTMKVRLIY